MLGSTVKALLVLLLVIMGAAAPFPVYACSQSTFQFYGPTPLGEVLSNSSGLPFWWPDAAASASTQMLWSQWIYPLTFARVIVIWAPSTLSSSIQIVTFPAGGPMTPIGTIQATRIGPTVQALELTDALNRQLQTLAPTQIGFQISETAIFYSVRLETVRC